MSTEFGDIPYAGYSTYVSRAGSGMVQRSSMITMVNAMLMRRGPRIGSDT